MSAAFYHVLPALRQVAFPLPHGKRPAFGWPAFSLRKGASALLGLAKTPAAPVRLRLTVALTERENKRIEAVSPASGEVLGVFDLRAPAFLETFEISLPGANGAVPDQAGIELRVVEGNDPIWFFGIEAGQKAPLTLSAALLPHLLEIPASADPMAEFYARFGSFASLQPFGPREGAVLDGLMALSRLPGGGKSRTTLNQHLAQFFDPAGRLKFEDGRSQTVEADFSGLESLAPLAALTGVDGAHPAIKIALSFLAARTGSDGTISDGPLSLADAFALAPFLAALSNARGGAEGEKWAQAAWFQLEARRRVLIENRAFWSLHWPDGRRQGQNRTQNIALWALAMVATLELLPQHAEAAVWRAEFAALSELIVARQRPDALWNAVFDDSQSPVLDVGASAGLALALARGVRAGLVPTDVLHAAARAGAALRARLSPDGFLVQPPATAGASGQLLAPAMGWLAALQSVLA